MLETAGAGLDYCGPGKLRFVLFADRDFNSIASRFRCFLTIDSEKWSGHRQSDQCEMLVNRGVVGPRNRSGDRDWVLSHALKERDRRGLSAIANNACIINRHELEYF